MRECLNSQIHPEEPITDSPIFQYMFAAHIIEILTSCKIGDLMGDQIWKPLGMTSTFASLEDAENAEEDLARGYYYSDGEYHEVDWMEIGPCKCCGNVISNVLDYAKWARAIMNKKIQLSMAGLEDLFRPRTIPNAIRRTLSWTRDVLTWLADRCLSWTSILRAYKWK
jgi:CubicO group peptidase (beta-lactamase class C family)